MFDEDIEQFIAITTASRRCALWFITHNSDLNDAVSSFYENGESSIPDDFDPEHEDMYMMFGEEEEEEADGEMPETTEEPEEIIEPTISPIQIQLIEDVEQQKDTPQQVDKNKIAEGSKLDYILQEIPNNKNVKEQNDDEIDLKKTKFKPRNNDASTQVFILWKNGYSIGNEFNEKNENEMREIRRTIELGLVPDDIEGVNDIQLVDKSDENYQPDFDFNKILVY